MNSVSKANLVSNANSDSPCCMHYDLGYFGDETCRLEPIENPFGPKVLPMSPE